ncbi:MAG: LPXTG cell wall anchor domain-containing protein [Actinomycetes bacterium]
MNVRRIVGLTAAAVALTVPMAAPAWAEPDYPPVWNQISASSFVVARGGAVTFKAQTFQAGSSVAYRVTAAAGTAASGSATADAKGVVTQAITFTKTGVNTVTFSGTQKDGGALELVAAVTVTAADSAGNGSTSGNGGASGSSNGNGSTTASNAVAGGIPIINGALPRTGAQIASTVMVAAALLLGGFALVAAARRRRES